MLLMLLLLMLMMLYACVRGWIANSDAMVCFVFVVS